MKILLVAKPWKGGLGRYYHLALQDMFPGQVEWISTRPKNFADYIKFRRDPKKWWNDLRQKTDAADCDAVFFAGYRKEFRELKPNARNVLYIVDDVRMQPGELNAFGRVFLSDPGYESELLAVLPAERFGGVLPFAHYPPLHRPASRSSRLRESVGGRGVCFIGNRDAKRDAWIEKLLASGVPFHVIGNYFLKSRLFWKRPQAFRTAIANDAMGNIYARHAVSLNVHAKVVRGGTNMRTFEAAGYGIPQVVEHRPGVENYFEPEREIMLCRDEDEMLAQIQFLLKDDAHAKDMAQAAHRRALAEHTYYHRIAAALKHLLPQPVLDQAFARVSVVE